MSRPQRDFVEVFSDASESADSRCRVRTKCWYEDGVLLRERTTLHRNSPTHEWYPEDTVTSAEDVGSWSQAVRRAVSFHDESACEAFAAHKEAAHRAKYNCGCVGELYGTMRASLPDSEGRRLGSCGRGLTAQAACEVCGGTGVRP